MNPVRNQIDFLQDKILKNTMKNKISNEIKKINKKRFPRIKSDNKAEKFVAKVDLADYDFSKFKKVDFELLPKSRPVSLRLPESLYKVVQEKAKSRGIKTQKFIRNTLERAVS